MANSATNIPVSQILKDTSKYDEEPKKKSREDWRKAKELEEARKAGTAPAAVDEEGKDINPHIPQYISSAPWYYGTTGPTLKHQRPQEEKQKTFSGIDEWYNRGVDTAKTATKYRKGACENCGALTHIKKDCMERPRKVGAKYSGRNIAADEFSQPVLSVSYDGKRDRWSGYDPSEHKTIIEEYQKIEEAKRQLRAEKLNSNVNPDEDLEEKEEDEDKYVDEVDMPGTKVDSKQRITVRNLRIREDTAKYLRNLDPNSAYYDPKTRSMRDNPNQTSKDDESYSGENFVRFSGDTRKHAQAQLFAWEAYEKGVDVHLLAEPTKLELLQKEYEKKKEQFKSQVQNDVLDRYGGEEHLEAPPKTLLLAQTEDYVEYSRYGKVVKGREKEIVRSKYEEDVFNNNHTSVWGSYWNTGRWGYKCCYSFIKKSYCLGEAGKPEHSEISAIQTETANVEDKISHTASNELKKKLKKKKKVKDNKEGDTSDSSSLSSNKNETEKESTTNTESINDEETSPSTSSGLDEKKKIKKKHKKKKKDIKEKDDSSDSSSSSDEGTKKANKKKMKKHKKLKKKNKEKPSDKLKQALLEEDRKLKEAKELLAMDERKRPYNSMYEVKKPTEEELEAYFMKRRREEDPMNQFM